MCGVGSPAKRSWLRQTNRFLLRSRGDILFCSAIRGQIPLERGLPASWIVHRVSKYSRSRLESTRGRACHRQPCPLWPPSASTLPFHQIVLLSCLTYRTVPFENQNKYKNNGEGGIRTPGRASPTQPFQGCSLSHSDTSPAIVLSYEFLVLSLLVILYPFSLKEAL